MASEARYLHGTHPDEQRRLALLNDLINAACVRELALRGGERILDVGAGLGQLTRALGRAVVVWYGMPWPEGVSPSATP